MSIFRAAALHVDCNVTISLVCVARSSAGAIKTLRELILRAD